MWLGDERVGRVAGDWLERQMSSPVMMMMMMLAVTLKCMALCVCYLQPSMSE